MIHLDTCFLIDLQRERKNNTIGPATSFLNGRPQEVVQISCIVAMEFCEGYSDEELWKAERLLRPFSWVPVSDEVAMRASRIRRSLRLEGRLIPDNDLLVAACAIQTGASLVTHNEAHFTRIEGLKLIEYGN